MGKENKSIYDYLTSLTHLDDPSIYKEIKNLCDMFGVDIDEFKINGKDILSKMKETECDCHDNECSCKTNETCDNECNCHDNVNNGPSKPAVNIAEKLKAHYTKKVAEAKEKDAIISEIYFYILGHLKADDANLEYCNDILRMEITDRVIVAKYTTLNEVDKKSLINRLISNTGFSNVSFSTLSASNLFATFMF